MWRRRTRAVWRFVKRVVPWALLAIFIYYMVTDRAFLNFMLQAAYWIGRILFAIAFVLVQFIALFWFLAKSKTETIRPGDAKSVTFDDYKGQPKLVELVRQWISLMSDREQFTKMGGNYINGILLYGPPGTGKTLLAKAMAGEADSAFISIEGSGFRAMFIGIDVLKMMQFTGRAKKLAREYGSCIAYIDEIDAVGASRGGVMGGQGITGQVNGMIMRLMGIHPVGPQREGMIMGMGGGGSGALTRLLTVMDGIDEHYTFAERWRNRLFKLIGKKIPKREWHVLFMGSTNRPDVLDPALTRPGRFDQLIQVDAPDRAGRREIIKYYLSKVAHSDDIDVEAIVNDTGGYTPAALMTAITKGAVRIGIFNGRDYITQSDIDRALAEQALGLENPIEELPEEQRRQIAFHEAGHAVAIYYLMPKRRLTRATIVRRGRALGMVTTVYEEEQHAIPLRDMISNIMVSMAGQVATKLCTGEPWSGASGGDYPNVRYHIWRLASEGYFGPPIADPSRQLAAGTFEGEIFDRTWDRIEKFWQETEDYVESFLKEHLIEVKAVGEALLIKETLMGEEMRRIITETAALYQNGGNGHYLPDPEIDLAAIAASIIDEADDVRRTSVEGVDESSQS